MQLVVQSTNWFQVIPASYSNVVRRIEIPDLPAHTISGSPTNIQIMVPSIAVSMTNGDEVTRGLSPKADENIALPPPSQPLPILSTPIKPTKSTEWCVVATTFKGITQRHWWGIAWIPSNQPYKKFACLNTWIDISCTKRGPRAQRRLYDGYTRRIMGGWHLQERQGGSAETG